MLNYQRVLLQPSSRQILPPLQDPNKQDHYDTTWAAAPTTKLPAQWLVVIGAFSHDHRGFVEGAKVLTHLQTHLCHIEVLRVKKMLRGQPIRWNYPQTIISSIFIWRSSGCFLRLVSHCFSICFHCFMCFFHRFSIVFPTCSIVFPSFFHGFFPTKVPPPRSSPSAPASRKMASALSKLRFS